MKKTFFYLFLVLVFGSMFLVSCEPKTDVDSNKDQTEQPKDSTDVVPDESKDSTDVNEDYSRATKLSSLYDAYYSNLYVDGVSNDYWMSFATDGLEVDEEYIYGTGEFVYLEVFPKTVENYFPVGKFPLAEDAKDGYAWAGWEYDAGVDAGYEAGLYLVPQGCFAYVFEDDELIETKYMVSGYIEIKGTSSDAEVFADVTFADGTKSTYYYKGKLKFEDYDNLSGGGGDDYDYNFDYEPTVAEDFDITMDICQILNYGDYYSTGSDFVELYLDGTEWLGVFDLFAPLNSGADVYGTYNIVADEYDAWTGVPSSGGDDYGDTPSFFGTGFTEDGYYTVAYYVVSGSVVIAEDGVTVDATTYYGSKIRASYVGDVVVETDDVQGVKAQQSVPSNQGRIKLVKASVEEMAYFGALKNRVRK